MSQEKYRKQHTVTEAYLRGFTATETPNALWEYDKTTNSCERRNVDKATVWCWAYSFKKLDGTWDHVAEKNFQKIENAGIPALRQLIALGDADSLSPAERHAISWFIAAAHRRSKMFVQHYQKLIMAFASNRERQTQWIEDAIIESGLNKDESTINEVKQLLGDEALDSNLDESKALHLNGLFSSLERGANLISGMHWHLLTTKPQYFFLTSDAPAYTRLTSDPLESFSDFVAFSNWEVELTFPVAKNCMLLARHKDWNEPTVASKSRVRELNARTIRMADNRVFAQIASDDIKKLVKSNRHFSPPRPPVPETIAI